MEFSKFCIFLCIFLFGLINASEGQSVNYTCPLAERIAPCTCRFEFGSKEMRLDCYGSSISQTSINTLFEQVRLVNPGEWLTIGWFFLTRTNLTVLDLTPMMKTRFTFMLYFAGNSELSSLIGPTPIESFAGQIDSRSLSLFECAMTDEGLGDSLKYFSSRLEDLLFSKNKFTGPAQNGSQEFFPGLWNFPNLDSVYLMHNNIRKIGGGQFKYMSGFTWLEFLGNDLEIGDGAFEIDPAHLPPNRVSILVDNCGLTVDRISPNHGLDSINHTYGYGVDFSGNNLHTLPHSIFEKILRNPNTSLTILRNPIICDSNVKWLKDEKEFFEKRVFGGQCVNDPGFTIFTSSLV